MEQRRANRYAFRMKAEVQSVGEKALEEAVETWTRDVSAKGVFLEFDEPLAEGTRIQLAMELPSEVTGKRVMLRCTSRVVRIVCEAGRRVGVGALIESYEFVRAVDQPN